MRRTRSFINVLCIIIFSKIFNKGPVSVCRHK